MFRCALLTLVFVIAVPAPAYAGAQVFESGARQTTLLELYTAQGCSTCPPADAWLTDWLDDPRLWWQLVPVAFHVTYWDDIGWPDPYGRPQYTHRQQAYAAAHGGEPYTPDFVRNGQDWRAWFRHPRPPVLAPAEKTSETGALAVSLDGERLDARFTPAQPPSGRLSLEVAVLAFGLTREAPSGRNKGQRLRHDFVVIGYASQPLAAAQDGAYHATTALPDAQSVDASRYALAAWVSTADRRPLQATGGWLAEEPQIP